MVVLNYSLVAALQPGDIFIPMRTEIHVVTIVVLVVVVVVVVVGCSSANSDSRGSSGIRVRS